MSDQAELAFVKNFTNTLSSQPVTFDNDFQQPPENTLKRVPVLQVPVPAPPERKTADSPSIDTVQVTFKSSKPSFSITLPVSLADSIATVKTQLAAQSRAPPADAQRLLLKGKALADTKLLKEYSVKEGDTVNLMVKPGFEWDPTKETPAPSQSSASLSPDAPVKKRVGHGRIPSVVLSPTPNSATEEVHDIPLVLESGITVAGETSRSSSPIPQTTYRATISQPQFWDAFENFLNASKGVLTANEIAKIRDHVGIIGMAGT